MRKDEGIKFLVVFIYAKLLGCGSPRRFLPRLRSCFAEEAAGGGGGGVLALSRHQSAFVGPVVCR